jgi:hypothetical protein
MLSISTATRKRWSTATASWRASKCPFSILIGTSTIRESESARETMSSGAVSAVA